MEPRPDRGIVRALQARTARRFAETSSAITGAAKRSSPSYWQAFCRPSAERRNECAACGPSVRDTGQTAELAHFATA